MATLPNLITLSGHTIDESRLPEKPVVLDVGCRSFDFVAGILKLRPGADIIALDPDPDIIADGSKCTFLAMALVHDNREKARYAQYSTGEGNFLCDAPSYYDAKMLIVPCTNIEKLMRYTSVPHWDVVKLDCEGSEFGILEHWPGPIADQISVEFHDYNRLEIRDGDYYAKLWAKLPGYRLVRHEITDISGQGARGHWDSLLVLD